MKMKIKFHYLIMSLLVLIFNDLAAQVQVKSVSKVLTSANEPSIAVDPFAARVLIGANVNQLYLSTDGGYNFEESKLKSTLGVYGDPVVLIDRLGNYYYSHLSKTTGKKAPEWWDRIVVQRSENLGDSFNDGVGVGYAEGKMQDKQWLTADMGKKSTYMDRLYLCWTEFDKYKSKSSEDSSRIKFAYSDNFGDTFSQPITISDTAGDCLDSDNTLEGVNIAIGPKGELYAVWAGRGNIYFDISLDGGLTWGKDRIIAKQVGGWDQQVPYLSRANSMPFIETNHKGHILIVFGDKRFGDLDIFGISSKDNGLTFAASQRINTDAVGNGKDQFMPRVTFDRLKKCFYVAYYSRENSMLNLFTEVKFAPIKKINKLNKLKTVTLTEMPFAPPGKQFFGDYMDMDALGGAIGVAWTEVDPNTNIILIKTSLGGHKNYVNHTLNINNKLNEYLIADSNLLYLNFTIAENKGYKIEVNRMGKVVYEKNQIEAVSPGTYEEKLKIKFISGMYEIKLIYKGQTFTKNFTIK